MKAQLQDRGFEAKTVASTWRTFQVYKDGVLIWDKATHGRIPTIEDITGE